MFEHIGGGETAQRRLASGSGILIVARQFRRAEFVKYLKLSKEDVEALLTLAVAENEDLKAKLNELNHGAFEVLCGALSNQSKERMQKLFNGFW